ncbi:TetR/AcrR family transcriptional regulator [Streptomyces sp. NPDC020965]|uniref:TetR/AcrR family transcriptional regulator n=1 Tax=Streptomyces sp. NPDC020965 TaxID=3365105 RepID=UPI00379C84FA
MTATPRDERPTGLRERKRRETHRLLATTALRLVTERGLDRVTVDDISGAAGVSPRTFFNYFACKEDALVVAYPDYALRLREAPDRIAAVPEEVEPLYAVAQVWREELERMDADREEWLTRLTLMVEHPLLFARLVALEAESEQRTVDALAARLGLDPDDPYPMLLYCVVDGALRACLQHWHRLGGTVSLITLLDRSIEGLARGLPAPPPRGGP